MGEWRGVKWDENEGKTRKWKYGYLVLSVDGLDGQLAVAAHAARSTGSNDPLSDHCAPSDGTTRLDNEDGARGYCRRASLLAALWAPNRRGQCMPRKNSYYPGIL
jgi:hypothetical protein